MPSDSLKINDCPYCRARPEIVDFFGLCQIRCPECNFHSSYYETVRNAIENFNDIASRTKGDCNVSKDRRVS